MFKYAGGPVDYWIVWRGARTSADAKLLVEDYEIIHETAHLRALSPPFKIQTFGYRAQKTGLILTNLMSNLTFSNWFLPYTITEQSEIVKYET